MMQDGAANDMADLTGPITLAEFRRRLAQEYPELSLIHLYSMTPDPGFMAYVVRTTDQEAHTWIYAPDEHDPNTYLRFACY